MADDPIGRLASKGFDAWIFAYVLAVLPGLFVGGAYWTSERQHEAAPFLTFAFAGAAAVLLCGAWHACTRRFAWTSLSTYLLIALAIGGLMGVVAFGTSGELVTPVVAVCGAMQGALLAWLIRRPDRDAPNPPTPAP